jgi:hypothetical protein
MIHAPDDERCAPEVVRGHALGGDPRANARQVHADEHSLTLIGDPRTRPACTAREVNESVTTSQIEPVAKHLDVSDPSEVQVLEASRHVAVNRVLRP